MLNKKDNEAVQVTYSNISTPKGPVRFSAKQLIIFVIVFAGIGGYLIFRSLAAAPIVASLQAERMTLPPGASTYSDPTASGGQAVKFSSNGTATGTVTIPSGNSATSLAVTAHGNSCHGSAYFSVSVDGASVLPSTSALTSSWTSYSNKSAINLASGTHTISITGSNIGKSHKCYRYLYLDTTALYGPSAPSAPTVSISSPANGTTVSGTTNVLAAASDSVGVTKVEFYVNNSLASTATTAPYDYAWNTTTLANGTYTLTAKAYDAAGGVGTSGNVAVTVGNSVPTSAPTGYSPYTHLVWSDEFNGAAGTQVDSSKWVIDTGTGGGSGWGNNELETYTNRTANVVMDGQGALNLIARKETYATSDGYTRNYTSGKIETQGKYSFTYGHAEARIWTPAGNGLWPAFWSLGNNWPNGGEIDTMEALGQDPYTVYAHIHGPQTGGSSYGYGIGYKASAPLTSGYHVYEITWQPGTISWQIDGNQYFSASSSTLPSGDQWIFNQPEWLVLNLSVGGNWPVAPDASTPWPSTMKVDWVRVFQ